MLKKIQIIDWLKVKKTIDVYYIQINQCQIVIFRYFIHWIYYLFFINKVIWKNTLESIDDCNLNDLTEVVEIEEDLFLKNLNVLSFFNLKYINL